MTTASMSRDARPLGLSSREAEIMSLIAEGTLERRDRRPARTRGKDREEPREQDLRQTRGRFQGSGHRLLE
jgi:hypothetical protein